MEVNIETEARAVIKAEDKLYYGIEYDQENDGRHCVPLKYDLKN